MMCRNKWISLVDIYAKFDTYSSNIKWNIVIWNATHLGNARNLHVEKSPLPYLLQTYSCWDCRRYAAKEKISWKCIDLDWHHGMNHQMAKDISYTYTHTLAKHYYIRRCLKKILSSFILSMLLHLPIKVSEFSL